MLVRVQKSKKTSFVKKDYIWNPATCSCKNGKYLASIIDNSVITCNEVINTTKTFATKTIPTDSKEKKVNCKTKNVYIFLIDLLITIALLITFSIYYYLIKYQVKQKHLLPYHATNNKLKEVLY